MSITVTLHAWWLAAYLGVGVALFLPLNYIGYRQLYLPREGFWKTMLHSRKKVRGFLIQVAAWPAAAWEVLR